MIRADTQHVPCRSAYFNYQFPILLRDLTRRNQEFFFPPSAASLMFSGGNVLAQLSIRHKHKEKALHNKLRQKQDFIMTVAESGCVRKVTCMCLCVNPKAMQTLLFRLRDVLKNSSWAWACSLRDFPADCSLQHHKTPALTHPPALRDSHPLLSSSLCLPRLETYFFKSPEATHHYNAPALESQGVSVCTSWQGQP